MIYRILAFLIAAIVLGIPLAAYAFSWWKLFFEVSL